MSYYFYKRIEPQLNSSLFNYFLPEPLWFVNDKSHVKTYACKLNFNKKELGKTPTVNIYNEFLEEFKK